MKLQTTNTDQLTEELNELKLKIAKMNARRNAQINLLKRDLDGRFLRNGTLVKSSHLYPDLYYDNSSYYRYPFLYPRYRSLENLQCDSYHPKPYRRAVAFTSPDRADDNGGNLKSNVASASMSDLLGKLKDFVFEQERQLTDDLLNKITRSRREESVMSRAASSTDLTKAGPFLKPANKKDNFYKRYNSFAKRILKPSPNLSTYKPLLTPRPWLYSDYDYWCDEPRWARWYRRYLTSPRYHHYLSDYNYYVPKLLTLPPDIESIVGDKTKSINCCRSYSPDLKSHSYKYDPFESDSYTYIRPRFPNWKQYYYTHKLKSKPSKESCLQYYDPHYDFFPETASVDSTDELVEQPSAVKELTDHPEQLLDEYRDAIYEDVIENIRSKQQRPSNTFPRRKPRRVQRSLSPTLPSKRSNVGWDDEVRSSKYTLDPPSSMRTDTATKWPYTKNASNDVHIPSYLRASVEDVKHNDNGQQKEGLIPTGIARELSQAPIDDVHKPSYQQSSTVYTPGLPNVSLDNMSEKVPSPARKSTVCSTPASNDAYTPIYRPLYTEREKEYEGTVKRPHSIIHTTTTVRPSEIMKQDSKTYKPLLYQPPTVERIEQPYERVKPSTPTAPNSPSRPSEIMKQDSETYKPVLYQPPTVERIEQPYERVKPSTPTVPNSPSRPSEIMKQDSEAYKSLLYQPSTVGHLEQSYMEVKPTIPNTQTRSQSEAQNTPSTRLFSQPEKQSSLSRNDTDTLQRDPAAPTSDMSVTSTVQRHNSPARLERDPAAITSDNSVTSIVQRRNRSPKTVSQQPSVERVPKTVSTPSTDESYRATEIGEHANNFEEFFEPVSSKPTFVKRLSSQLIEPQANTFSSTEMRVPAPAPLRRRSSQLIAPLSLEPTGNISVVSTEVFDVTNKPAPPRRRSSQLIAPSSVFEESKFSIVPTESLHRPTPLKRRTSQLIAATPTDQGNISILTSAEPLDYVVNNRPAPLLTRRSSQLIATPITDQGGNIFIGSADPSQWQSESELVKNFAEPGSGKTVPLLRRQSSKFIAAPTVEQAYDPRQGSNYPLEAERRISIDQQPNVYQSDEIRDPNDTYKSTDFSQPIYEQPREENNVDYYYTSGNYQPSMYDAGPIYGGEDLRQPVGAVPYDEGAFQESYYHPNEQYYGENSAATYDPNTAGLDAYYPRGGDYVEYTVQEDPHAYNVVGDNVASYTQNKFAEQYTADENSNVVAPTPSVDEPSPPPEARTEDGGKSTSVAKGAIKPPETLQPDKLGGVSGSKTISNAQDRKKSVENPEGRNRESISRRASKISIQSSVDERRSKAQPTVGEVQKRAPKAKQGENKLKRTASTVSRTKTPFSKRI